MLARRVYLMNVPYDAYGYEIENLVKEFAPVEKVVIPRDPKGWSRGYAFVYLEKASDVNKVIDFVDGRHLRSRQIRAKTSLGGEALFEQLKKEKQNMWVVSTFKNCFCFFLILFFLPLFFLIGPPNQRTLSNSEDTKNMQEM